MDWKIFFQNVTARPRVSPSAWPRRLRLPEPVTVSTRDIIVGDTSGLHVMSVDYCGCLVNGAFVKWDVQCLRHRLFPVTIKKPRTVFTFEAIELFHELTLQGKTTAYDFYRSIGTNDRQFDLFAIRE